MKRIWAEAAGFPKYQVSNDGFVRNKAPRSDRGEFLNPAFDKNGYKRLTLYRGEPLTAKNVIVHRLVWESFNSPIPAGMQINHKNGIKNDNRLENLEVCTPSENTLHGFRVLGRKPVLNPHPGSKNGRAKLNEADIPVIRKMLRAGDRVSSIARLYKVSPASIYFIQQGCTWKNVRESST